VRRPRPVRTLAADDWGQESDTSVQVLELVQLVHLYMHTVVLGAWCSGSSLVNAWSGTLGTRTRLGELPRGGLGARLTGGPAVVELEL
jgi:hypothetical protein